MAAVTIYTISWLQSLSALSDFGAQKKKKKKSLTVSTVSPSICREVMGPDAVIVVSWMLSFQPTFSLSSFTFIKRLFSSSLSDLRVVSSVYLRLLMFLLEILIPAYASSNPAFLMMYSAYRLNKQGNNIQPWHTPFPILKQSLVPYSFFFLTTHSFFFFFFLTIFILNCCFLTYIQISQGQVRWSGIPITWRIFHSLLWSTQSKALA